MRGEERRCGYMRGGVRGGSGQAEMRCRQGRVVRWCVAARRRVDPRTRGADPHRAVDVRVGAGGTEPSYLHAPPRFPTPQHTVCIPEPAQPIRASPNSHPPRPSTTRAVCGALISAWGRIIVAPRMHGA